MPDDRLLRQDLVYVYEPCFDGFLSAVFDAFAHRPMPCRLMPDGCQQEFGMTYRLIATEPDKAARVRTGIRGKLGRAVLDTVSDAFLHDDDACGDALYHYLRLGFEVGAGLTRYLSDDRVIAVNKRAQLVRREASFLTEFVRFAELTGGVWFANVSPQYAVLPLLMPFFVNRFHVQPFMIYDDTHRQAGVYDRKSWYIRETDGLILPARTENEEEMRRLWKCFYDTVAIESRINPQLHRQLMPKKYWKNMVEMQPVRPAGEQALPGFGKLPPDRC